MRTYIQEEFLTLSTRDRSNLVRWYGFKKYQLGKEQQTLVHIHLGVYEQYGVAYVYLPAFSFMRYQLVRGSKFSN